MTDFEFIFENFMFELVEKKNLIFDGYVKLEDLKGFYSPTHNSISVILGHVWAKKSYDYFVKEITKTITHEFTHSLIDTGMDAFPGEEKICMLMAGQIIRCEVPSFV